MSIKNHHYVLYGFLYFGIAYLLEINSIYFNGIKGGNLNILVSIIFLAVPLTSYNLKNHRLVQREFFPSINEGWNI